MDAFETMLAAADEYRLRNQLPPDAQVKVAMGDDGNAYVWPAGSWLMIDGGTLDMAVWRHGLRRWPYLARRAWSWVRYGGWRWWD